MNFVTMIAPTTDAADSNSIILTDAINGRGRLPTTFFAVGFVGDDAVKIQFSVDDGANWIDLKLDGVDIELNAVNNAKTVYGPGLYRLSKGVTTGEVGVVMCVPKGG
jgi:hypothetical protein